MIEWIDEDLQWLGQTQVEESALIEQEKKELDTGDKILIASLFLSIVTFAWQVWTWRKEKK